MSLPFFQTPNIIIDNLLKRLMDLKAEKIKDYFQDFFLKIIIKTLTISREPIIGIIKFPTIYVG